MGVRREERAALLLERSPDLIVALFAVWKAGGAAVVLDPTLPEERLAALLADAEPVVVLKSLSDLPPLPGEGWAMGEGGRGGEGPAVRVRAPLPSGRPQDLAYLIYTSGTTGAPKAVLVEHGSLVHTLDALGAAFGFGPGDRMPHLARFSFDIALFELLAPLLGGGTCEILREEEVLEPERLAAALARATRFHAVPSLMRQIVAQGTGKPAPPGLRTLFTGGDLVPPELLAELLAAFPVAEVAVLYGPTEAAIVASAWRVPKGARPERSRIGRPLPGVRFLVFDRHGRLAAPGVPGELCIGGPGVARGYFRRAELTAEKFFLRDGLRWYRSGDLVRRLPDGSYEFLGRTDGQVKIRGFRIEPGEIEALLDAHPAVREAVVVARPEARGGEQRLVAYAVPVEPVPEGQAVEGETDLPEITAALREHLAARLPTYMVPSALVLLPELPLTSHGKVDRARLPEPPERRSAAFEPPCTETERLVAEVWGEVLGVERIGRGDDFFALGGHSLLATQVMIRLRGVLGIELPVRLVFQEPTLAGMAAVIDASDASDARAAGPAAASQMPLLLALARTPRGESPLPLSFSQERLWFLDRLAPGSPAYNLALALRIRGPLDRGALDRAFTALAARHEALRTSFVEDAEDAERAGTPVQEITDACVWELPVVDLAPGGPEAEIRRLAAADALRPFDLAKAPLLRAALLHVSDEEHVLLLAIHHIVSDAWSLGVLVRDLTALYAGEELPPLAVQPADHAVWQRAWLAGAELERQLAFWRGHLAGAPAALDLPADRPRPPVQSLRGGRVPVALSAERSAALAALARGAGGTPYMILLAAWNALLSRISGQLDLVAGTAAANRDRPELEPLIGFFVNTLALRADLSGDPPFRGLVERARQTVLAAFAHRDLPFEKLVEELHPVRDRSRQPLFQVMITFQNVPPSAVAVPGLSLAALEIENETAKFDLTLTLSEERGAIRGSLEYASDLFDRATAARIAAWFETLLAGAMAAPETRLSDLPLLAPADLRQLLAAGDRTGVAFPREATLHGLFAEQAARAPEAVALVRGEESATYRELAARAERLARHLLALGIGIEERIGLCAGRSTAMIAATLGILAAGGAYLPLDPSYPPKRLGWMLADAGVKVLLAERRLLAEVPAELAREGLRVLWLEDLERTEEPPAVPLPEVPAAALAYVMYTSGSTGRPKGVAVTHRNVVRLVRGVSSEGFADMGPGETWLQFAPLSFDVATLEIWAPLANGGRLVLFPGERASLDGLAEEIERSGVTSLWLTSGLFHQMADHRLDGLRPLRQLLAGGDVVSPEHARRVLQELPGIALINGYGPTEGTTFSCCYRMTGGMTGGMTDPRQAGASVPIGPPIANARAYVLDGALQPVPFGVAGELCIGGVGVARGYLGRPELTAERFVPDPFAAASRFRPGERLYRSGDRVRWVVRGGEHVLEFLGRVEADAGQVKIRGFRVETGEIEAALTAHPAVRQAAVLVRDVPERGRELAACVVRAESVEVTAAELQRHLRTRLPEPMVPAAWVFLDALPLTANGKVDRRALAGAAGGAGAVREQPEYLAPRTPLERQLVEACAEVLGLEPEKIGVLDNFFDLGGHSLLATRLIADLRLRRAVEVPLQLLFDAAHLADLAERVTERELARLDPEDLEAMIAEMAELQEETA
jgi:amino acid adenylation domain-containing protein